MYTSFFRLLALQYFTSALILGAKVPTITSTASSSCTEVLLSPTPNSLICGVEGRLRKPTTNTNITTAASYPDCLQKCLAEPACLTFGYTETSSQTCQLFNESLVAQKFIDSATEVFFWTKKCFKKTCGSAKSTVSSASTDPTKATTFTTIAKSSSVSAGTIGNSDSTSSGHATSTSHASGTSTSTKPSSTSTAVCEVPLPLNVKNCKHIQQATGFGEEIVYALYFNGTGLRENTVNPGNPSGAEYLQPMTTSINGTVGGCEAATQCALVASGTGLGSVYESFDLHYSLTTCGWQCVTYALPNNQTRYFDVVDSTILRVHGFSGDIPKGGIHG